MSDSFKKRRCEMRILGLTGSIGMGKSTTAKLFVEAGVPVYDADAAVHKIYEGEAAPAIEAAFPGTTSRAGWIAQNSPPRWCTIPPPSSSSSRSFTRCSAPRRKKFLDDAERAGAPVVVMDIPLLFETGGEKRVDAVVVVTTSPESQRERILARGTMTSEALDAILARQLPDAEKRKRADFVVDTSHGLDPVRAQLKRHSGRGR